MALWQKLWLLFTVIWVVVAGLQVMTILVFSEGELEREKALLPLVLVFVVPAVAYGIGWIWAKLRERKLRRGSGG
ncbi:MAG TPA: hypothetical protein VET51_09425 [Burkholderiales bacterium]|nr:hypothetical protein [Burkholderiales bacterium]